MNCLKLSTDLNSFFIKKISLIKKTPVNTGVLYFEMKPFKAIFYLLQFYPCDWLVPKR